jgi:hypothetical protein
LFVFVQTAQGLVNKEFKEGMAESGGGLTEVQSLNLSEGAEENHAVLQSR